MRAVGYRTAGGPGVLEDLELPVPEPGPRDLLVRVEAVSVNPVDVKTRAGDDPGGRPRVLGFDAAGVVSAVGAEVSLFAPGDEVYYAGAIDRPGSDQQLHLVDERLAGRRPRTLTPAAAAALPLTAITAWETLFDTMTAELGPIGAEQLRKAHEMVEDGHMTGKVVVAGF
ncbi:alcohol dehydrogenase catalytic domain-containing protein [Dactylosporangium salmoneum]